LRPLLTISPSCTTTIRSTAALPSPLARG
jgi:hypothetical protein